MTTGIASDDLVVSYLETTLGLNFTGPRRARLLTAVEAQRAAAGLSPDAFLTAVSRPGAAFDQLVAAVTVGETSFFRDRLQCDLLRAVVFPELAGAGPERRYVLWSAGCASGEEAFTLAALADEAGLGERYVVVGTDVSRRALDKAGGAAYGPWSMRSTTAAERAGYFREQHALIHVREHLRRRTRFLQHNLLDGPAHPGHFDVVLCRNLLIYLTPEGVRRAADVLTAALAPNGWLLTASGDPPLDAPGLERVRTRFGLAYRRTHAAASGERKQPAAPGAALGAPTPRTSILGTSRHLRARRPQPGSPAACTWVEKPTAHATTPVQRPADEVRSLGDAGRLDEACASALAAVEAEPLNVELRYLAGVILFEAGRLEEATSSASSAVYLQPDLPAPHLLLGQVEHARGNTDRAHRSFRTASRLLAAVPSETPVALAGDVPAGHLAAIATRYVSTHRARR